MVGVGYRCSGVGYRCSDVGYCCSGVGYRLWLVSDIVVVVSGIVFAFNFDFNILKVGTGPSKPYKDHQIRRFTVSGYPFGIFKLFLNHS